MHLQNREENTRESTRRNLSMCISVEKLLQKAWTLVLILTSFHTYLRLFNESSIKNFWIRMQNYSSCPRTSCLCLLSPINYNISCILYLVSKSSQVLCTLTWPPQWDKCSLPLLFCLPWPIPFSMERVCVPLHLLRLQTGYLHLPAGGNLFKAFSNYLTEFSSCSWMKAFCALMVTEL